MTAPAEPAFAKYVDRVHETELIPHEETCRLAEIVQLGRKARDRLDADDVITNGERRALRRLIAEGDFARRQLIEANLRLVLNRARRWHTTDLSFDDLVQAGNIGLIRAVDKFDPTRGVRFGHYAKRWIAYEIQEAIRLNRTAVLPLRVERQVRSGIADEDSDVRKVITGPVALDADDSLPLPDTAELVDDQVLQHLSGEAVRRMCECLTAEQLWVVDLHYGLTDDEPLSYEKIGAILNCPGRHVKYVHAKALAALQASGIANVA